MNENTIKLLEQLAQKLGCTTEYIWKILVRQAPIDSAIGCFQLILIAAFGYVLYKLHKRFLRKNEDGESIYSEYDESASYPMVGGAFVFAILLILGIACIGEILTGFFSPEYWALHKIIEVIKGR